MCVYMYIYYEYIIYTIYGYNKNRNKISGQINCLST